MKILTTVSDTVWGGKHRYMADVVDELRRRGHELELVAEAGSAMERWAVGEGVPCTTVLDFGVQHASSALESRLAGPERDDVVMVTGRRDSIAVSDFLSGRDERPAFVMFRHSAFELGDTPDVDRLLDAVDLVVATSLEQAQRQFDPLVAVGRLRAEQVMVLSSSVDAPFRERLDSVDRDEVRRSLGLGTETFVFLTVARLSWEKGVDRVLRAFGSLPGGVRDDAVVVVAGDGPERAALEALTDELCVREQVVFLGHVEDMAPVYRAADVAVLASTVPETGPLALKEAMTAGVAVIASRIGGIPEFVRDGVHGLLVDSDDALTDAMGRFLQDEALVGQLGSRARRDALATEQLGPRMDHLELRLDRVHLARNFDARIVQGYRWADVRLHGGARPMAFVPANSSLFELEAHDFAIVRRSLEEDDPTVLASGVSPAAADLLRSSGALIPRRHGRPERGR